MRTRIKLDFVIDSKDVPLPSASDRLLDGFEGAVRGLYPNLPTEAVIDILPGGRAHFTKVK